VGYQHFSNTWIAWKVEQGVKIRRGYFFAASGSNYHFLTKPLGGATLRSGANARVTFYWVIYGVHYHYAITRTTGC
jgi:hypothetical protein